MMKSFWRKRVRLPRRKTSDVPGQSDVTPKVPSFVEDHLVAASTASRVESLCPFCRNINYEALHNRDEGYGHLDDIWDLSESAKTCAICNLILLLLLESAASLKDYKEDFTDLDRALETFKPYLAEKGYILERPCRLVLEVYPSGSLGYKNLHVGGEFKKSPDVDWANKEADFPLRVSLGSLILHVGNSELTPKPIVTRVNDSDMLAHLSRLLFQNTPWQTKDDIVAPLPTRVLDLGYFPESTLTSPQSDLRLSDATGYQGVYVTLSYCWGSYKECRTLTENLTERKDRIAFEDLPEVFQQAVMFTRALKVQFLWIDALCIVQDDPKDWEREAARMADVYSNSFCRLAVTESKRPTEPFWPPKSIVPSVRVSSLQVPGKDGDDYYITLRKSYHDDVERGPLNRRGWVLQERLLAPRTIHFTKDHVYYEDDESIIGEDGISGAFTWLSCINKSSETTRMNLFPEFRSFEMGNYNANESGEDSWLKIAELFSECQLSYPTDKLVALAGIVSSKQGSSVGHKKSQYTGSNYLLGLWEPSLHIDLVWVARGTERLKFQDTLQLPSWSWLAYEGPIRFTKDRRSLREPETVLGEPESAIKLVDYKVAGFKQLLPAKQKSFLVLTARLQVAFTISDSVAAIPSKFETKEQYFARSPFTHDPQSSTFPIQLSSLSTCREVYDSTILDAEGNPNHIGFVSFDDDTQPPHPEELVLAHTSTLRDGGLPTFRAGAPAAISFFGRTGRSVQPILAYALVLRKTIGDEYLRVGVAEVNFDWMMAGTESTVVLV